MARILGIKMPLTSGSAQPIPGDQRFELLVDAIADYAIYMLDPEGLVTTWNTGAEKIKGYTEAEVLGQPFSLFFTPEDVAAGLPERILAEARAHGRHEAEGWRLRKDGNRFWANGIVQRVLDEQGELLGFAKITRDITERVATQQALAESEKRFRMLVEGVTDYAICRLDTNGLVSNWNAGAERMMAYRAGEIVGQHFSRFYTKEERAAGLPARALDTAARQGRNEAEGWRVRKDGSRFWASEVIDAIHDPGGRLEGFAQITRDITERRAAHDVLRESERQFRLLVGNVRDYALYMPDPNGIVTSWNAGAERIKGFTADEIIGQHFSRFYTERDRAAGAPLRALNTALEQGHFEADTWRQRKGGELFWAHVVIEPIRDENGQLVGFAKITRDISERRAAELALQAAETQRAQAQKMDALGQLTGGVAHDFNNLLMIVLGHIQTLKRKVVDDARASRAAEAIEMAGRRGAALTRQLLTFSRRQPFNPTVVTLGERIEACRAMLASSLGAAVRLVTAVGAEVWPVKVDAGELELALVNLTLNARDAMTDGGTIAVNSTNVTLAADDTPDRLQGDFVALSVSDTGSGIAPDLLPKVFDPFFTTKGVDKGSGLGLSQVYGFAHQSGGTVTIRSELGRGTTVTLYLPRAEEQPQQRSEAPAEVEAAGGGLVLLVEDNPEVSEVTAAMLQQLGYRVQSVRDAQSALEALGENRAFDLVMSDIVMAGGMNGLDLARAVRERTPELPVLLITGYSHLAPQVGSEFTLLRKPFDLAELSRVTARMIAQAGQTLGGNVVRLRDARPPHKPG
jgi:PAS domain S-box-containing protein